MDSSPPLTCSHSFIDLLNSQQEIGLEGLPSQTPSPSPTNREPRHRWTLPEEKVLVSAWLNTSKDSVVGNEQKGGAFWSRVAAYYAACPSVSNLPIRESNIVLEAVASQDLWIWHAFFGPPGTCNDINVLDRSPVFDDILQGIAPKVSYFVNGRQYHMAYYLTDGIYPKWATFIQSISRPQGPKASLFANYQEAVRKDVERAFGVLQARFAIVRNPALSWDKAKISKIMRACIILHNMIVEDERDQYTQYDLSDFEQGEGSRTSQVDYAYSMETSTNVNNMMANRAQLREEIMHHQLKYDLVEHIWQKFGTSED